MSEQPQVAPQSSLASNVRVAPLTDVSVPAFFDLFLRSNSQCFCQYWHFQGTKNEWLAELAEGGAHNRDAASESIQQRTLNGLVALADDVVVGWLKLEPKPQLLKLTRQSVYRNLVLPEATQTMVVGCMLVAPEWRGRGVARTLLQHAPAFAAARGAQLIEAYPRIADARLHEEEAFMGPAAVFAELGFKPVAGELPYPVLRLELGAASRDVRERAVEP
jgi:GNAT superfamily N-acetyltransferase